MEDSWTEGSQKDFDTESKRLVSDALVFDHGFGVVVCDKSMLFLAGTEVDWKDHLFGASSCGCQSAAGIRLSSDTLGETLLV
jgi:Fe-S cluster assembly iron-binding protein IscA